MTEFSERHEGFRSQVPPEVREHMSAARAEMRKGVETFFPADFFEHRDTARREMLLAWRGVIDAAISRIDARTSRP